MPLGYPARQEAACTLQAESERRTFQRLHKRRRVQKEAINEALEKILWKHAARRSSILRGFVRFTSLPKEVLRERCLAVAQADSETKERLYLFGLQSQLCTKASIPGTNACKRHSFTPVTCGTQGAYRRP